MLIEAKWAEESDNKQKLATNSVQHTSCFCFLSPLKDETIFIFHSFLFLFNFYFNKENVKNVKNALEGSHQKYIKRQVSRKDPSNRM